MTFRNRCTQTIKGTLMRIWKSCNTFNFIQKIVSHRLRIITPFTIWHMRSVDLRNDCLQIYRNNRIRSKVAYFLRKIQTLRVNNSRILTIKNAKFSGHYFCMNLNIWGDFQICISVTLSNDFLKVKANALMDRKLVQKNTALFPIFCCSLCKYRKWEIKTKALNIAMIGIINRYTKISNVK